MSKCDGCILAYTYLESQAINHGVHLPYLPYIPSHLSNPTHSANQQLDYLVTAGTAFTPQRGSVDGVDGGLGLGGHATPPAVDTGCTHSFLPHLLSTIPLA
jgi:hypothetical protein